MSAKMRISRFSFRRFCTLSQRACAQYQLSSRIRIGIIKDGGKICLPRKLTRSLFTMNVIQCPAPPVPSGIPYMFVRSSGVTSKVERASSRVQVNRRVTSHLLPFSLGFVFSLCRVGRATLYLCDGERTAFRRRLKFYSRARLRETANPHGCENRHR